MKSDATTHEKDKLTQHCGKVNKNQNCIVGFK